MRGILKGTAVTVILVVCVAAIPMGMVYALAGGGWRMPLGVGMFVVALRGIVFAYDWMWGRPPAFSKRPWERPWEDDTPSGP